MDVAVSRYDKPFTSVPEQVELLRKNGMVISDPVAAEATLRRCGYYRFSGYTHFFRSRPSMQRFISGTTLEQVHDLYDFDAALRSIILEGIAQIEPSFRFHVGHRLGRSAKFAHRRGVFLNDAGTMWIQGDEGVKLSRHAEWAQKYSHQESTSQETFVQHFRRRYGPQLPVWVATEVMTLGPLTRLYDLMPDNDRKLVAARFGLLNASGDGDAATLSNWMNFVRHIRNVCAHHSRMWNRSLDVAVVLPPKTIAPEMAHLTDAARRKLYGALCILRYLIARVDPDSDWFARALAVVTDFARTSGIPVQTMGFPEGWQSEMIWAPEYVADMLLRDVADGIDAVAAVNRPEAMTLVAKKGDEAARKKWLRYLVRRNALLAHSIDPQQYFPTFQFADGDVSVPVADVNELLLARIKRTQHDPVRATLTAQRWWTSANPAHGFLEPPMSFITMHPDRVRRAARTWSSSALIGIRR